MLLDYYRNRGVNETCHGAAGDFGREKQVEAINKIANYIVDTKAIQPGSYIVPSPQHTGKAEYTLEIADKVAERIDIRIADILIINQSGNMELNGDIPEDGKIYFLDTVYKTGKTFEEAKKILGLTLIPLIYAKDRGGKDDIRRFGSIPPGYA